VSEVTHYIDSDRKPHLITAMPNGYLHNALAKMLREPPHPGRVAMVLAMDAEVRRRETARQEEVASWVARAAASPATLEAE
jgi:hypothetical protein